MDPVIALKNVSFSYVEDHKVIDDVSFAIKKGSYTAILGHNGSGKSTIAKLIIGLMESYEGEIIVGGVKLSDDTLYDVRRQIGIVFQNPDNQFIGTTVRDDIAFGLENICIPHDEMDDLINTYAKKVNMSEFLDHEPTKLSGGQKQRVAIAGILAMHPSIIILDEATSMLDPLGRADINRLVHELNVKNNMTILSITHDIEEAAMADDVILLSGGKVITQGKPEDVLSDVKQIEALRLDVPFAYKVSKALREDGVKLQETIDQEKLVNMLWQLHSNK